MVRSWGRNQSERAAGKRLTSHETRSSLDPRALLCHAEVWHPTSWAVTVVAVPPHSSLQLGCLWCEIHVP